MKSFKEFLAESIPPNSSAVLPATRVLFQKNKISPKEVAADGVWNSGTVHTYMHADHGSGKEKHFHVFTSGKSTDPIGKYENFHHDQTFRRMHSGKLVGKSFMEGGKVTGIEGEDHSNTKAPIHVYK